MPSWLSNLLSPIGSGLNDVAYQALGGPLLGDVLRPPTPAVTPTSLLAPYGGTAPAPTPANAAPAAAGQAAPAAGTPAPSAQTAPAPVPSGGTGDPNWDALAQQSMPGPQVNIPGAPASQGTPAAAPAPASATAPAAAAEPPTSADLTKQAMQAAANVLQQQPAAQWQPTKGEKGVMLRNFLGSIGGAMQAGQTIQSGVDAYRTATLSMLQTQQQARQALADRQAMQAFSAAIGAAQGDPKAIEAVVTQFGAALPKDYMAGMAAFIKANREQALGKAQTIVGPDGKLLVVQPMVTGGSRVIGTAPPQKDIFSYTPDGNVLNKQTGEIMPGPIFKSYLTKNNGDWNAAYADMKQAALQPTEAGIYWRAAGGDQQAQRAVTVEQQAKGIGPQLSGEALDKSAQFYHDTGQLPPLGRSGAMDRARIINRESEMFPGSSIAGSKMDYASTQSTLTQIAERNAQIEANERTANSTLGGALAYSKMIDRTGAPLWNRFKQATQQEIHQDPNLSTFQNHIETFANEYAAVMTPQGRSTDSAKEHARDLLSSADSQATFEQRAANLQWEMQQRRANLSDVENSLRQRYGGVQRPVDRPAANPPGTPAPAYASDGNGNWIVSYDGWKTHQPSKPPGATPAAGAPQTAPYQPGGVFNGEQIRNVTRVP